VRCACIARHRDEFPVRLMCRVLAVSSSGFYAWCKRAPSARAIANERLLLNVRVAFTASDETYGAPRIHRELQAQGEQVGRHRVARLMREDGLIGRPRASRRPRTTDSTHNEPIAPNLLDRQFDVKAVTAVNQVWVSDITYVPTREGFLYLATVLDLASRRVVGWAMRATLDAELAVSALEMAVGTRQPASGLVHHSDRGSQYASAAYRALLAQHGMVASMSRRGDCWDNAVAESFFATLELELIVKSTWRSRDAARLAIFRYIETWYNRKRRHSTLGYVSPTEYEAQLEVA
jgi:putative transposase